MAQADSVWYDLIGSEMANRKLVTCDYYASVFSLAELERVQVHSKVPISTASFKIADQKNDTVFEGVHSFGEHGVANFFVTDVLPLSELLPYETQAGAFYIRISVTLVTGNVIPSYRVLEGTLRKGITATDLPKYDFLERLAAIPVARPDMTEDELRKICLDYLTLECEFAYKFKEDYEYTVIAQGLPRVMKGNTVYGGIPYVSRGAGNLYRIAEFFDPQTGTLDTSGDIFQNIRHFGNACSGGACTAWARVVTSAYLGYTMFLSEGNGFLPVGPYRYSKKNVTRFVKKSTDPDGYHCEDICRENGEQIMFESYAMMKPADGIGCCGHVRMNSTVPTVIRNPDGTIDPDRSFTHMTEQVCYVGKPNHIRIAPDGSHYTAQGLVDLKYTFRQLFDGNYIPFTFAEFRNPALVEEAKIRLSVEPELKMQVLTSNYPISDIFCETEGKRYVFRNEEFFRKEVKLGDIFPEEALTNKTRIYCRLYNGETHKVCFIPK